MRDDKNECDKCRKHRGCLESDRGIICRSYAEYKGNRLPSKNKSLDKVKKKWGCD